MQGAQVRSLVGELRSRMLHGAAKKKKRRQLQGVIRCEEDDIMEVGLSDKIQDTWFNVNFR